MSRQPYVSRAARIARGEDVSSSPALSSYNRMEDGPAASAGQSTVETRNSLHVATHDNERVFSEKGDVRADLRMDADQRHAMSPSSGNPAVAAPPSDDERPRTCKEKIAGWMHYETTRVVNIKSKKTGFIFHIARLLIIGYIVGYSIVYKKGYQATDAATGESLTKIKGVAYQNGTQPWYGPNAKSEFLVYDALDLVSPPLEADCLFITSNQWTTIGQIRSVCPSYTVDGSNSCRTDADCKPLKYVIGGRQTGLPGSCRINYTDPEQLWPAYLPNSTYPGGGFCDVYGWCPTEQEMPLEVNTFRMWGVETFTLFSRIMVHFPNFHEKLDNTAGMDALTPGLNFWSVNEIVELLDRGAARESEVTKHDVPITRWKDVNETGVLVAMQTIWNCDFDKPDTCKPNIEFVRLDNPNSKLSSGFNFRSAEFVHDARGSRQLSKKYGFRLLILMTGVGGRFDPVALLTAIGAGIGLLSVATLVADFIATKLLVNRAFYKQAKFEEVTIQDPESDFLHTLRHTSLLRALSGEHSHGGEHSHDGEHEHGTAAPVIPTYQQRRDS